MDTPFKTSNDLPAESRLRVIDLLNQRLADVADLRLQAKHAHWNVKGPHFFALHELFDKVAAELDEFTDEIAERAVQLGGVASGTIRAISAQSTLPPYPSDAVSGPQHLTAITARLADFAASIRSAIDAATAAGDADTADLFTEVSRGTDKLLWLVEAHIQSAV